MQMRTQIYLEPAQHSALLKAARQMKTSLAGMVRKLVDDHLIKKEGKNLSQEQRKKAALSLVGMFSSGISDVSERHDKYLGKGIYEEMIRRKRTKHRA